MFTQIYYLVRSRVDGSYLVAHLEQASSASELTESPQRQRYLLMFREQFDALSYLNTHAAELANRFAVESVSGNQVEGLLKRWDFSGIGMVQDPLIPRIEFLARQPN